MTPPSSQRPRVPRSSVRAVALLILAAIGVLPWATARSQDPEPEHAEAPEQAQAQAQEQVRVQVRVQAQGAGPAAVIVQEGVVADVMIVEAPAAAMPQEAGAAPADALQEGPQDHAAMLQEQIAAQAAQYEALIDRVLVQELALARTLRGDLSAESRRRIRVAGEDAVKSAAQAIAAGFFQQQQAEVVPQAEPENLAETVGNAVVRLFGLEPARPAAPPPPPPPPPVVDPEAIVGEAVATALEAEAGAEAGRAFRDELAARRTRQRRLAVGRVIRLLDDDLHFTAPQRRAIRDALEANWSDDFLILEEMGSWTIDGRPVYAGLDRTLVLPHLTEIQRSRLGETDESQQEMVRVNLNHWRQSRAVNRLMRRGHEAVEHDAWWAE